MSPVTAKKRRSQKRNRAAPKAARRRGAAGDWKKFFESHPPVIANSPADLSSREGFGR
jgi:hypothetical protein